jgi:hypothetical protein
VGAWAGTHFLLLGQHLLVANDLLVICLPGESLHALGSRLPEVQQTWARARYMNQVYQ